jgi:ATP-dependent helicase/nuclease subunit A
LDTLTSTSDIRRPENVVIRASAGTGKTHQLSNRFLKLLLLEQPVDRILATTFTRKAAGEIFDRIVSRLVVAIDDDTRRQQLADALDVRALSRQTCIELLTRLTRQLHRTRVVTIDAFFAELAHRFALELPLPTNWRIADESMEDAIRGQAIERLLRDRGKEASIELVRLLAKGETKRGVDRLINDTIEELFQTYREAKPAGQGAWVWITPGPNIQDAQVESAIGALEVAKEDASQRLAKSLRAVIDLAIAGKWEEFARATLAKKVALGQLYYNKPLDDSIIQPVRTLLRRATFMIRARMKHQLEACYRLLRDYERHYRDVCNEMEIAFFSDIPDALRDLDDRQNSLAYRLDSRIDHLLLDEFQDTSAGQWNIFRGLTQRIISGNRSSLFCVGDVKQAIYAWRNGTSEILESLDKHHDGLKAFAMDDCRRSGPPVIDTVNRVFLEMGRHCGWTQHLPTIDHWIENFPEHTVAVNAPQHGYACLRSSALGEDAKEAIYQRTAEVVDELWHAAPQYSIGVLVRTNHAVGRIMHALRGLGVNASEEGGNPLTNSTPVRIILSLMRLADHPFHSAARFHVAHSPLAPALGIPTEHPTDHQAAQTAAQRLRTELLTLGYGATVAKYANALARSCTPFQEKRLQQLVDLAYVFGSRATTRADDFVNFVQLRRVADPTAANIHVMTVHQAKGLEFDRVVVTELEKTPRNNNFVYERDLPLFCPSRICPAIAQEILPHMPIEMQRVAERDRDRRFREELCVLYVALTRAKYELQIVVAPNRPTQRKKPPAWPKNMAGLVRAAVCETPQLEPDTIAYETGRRDWYLQLPDRTADAQPVADAQRGADADAERPTRSQRAALPLRFQERSGSLAGRLSAVTPSQLEGGNHVSGAELFCSSRAAAMEIGTLLHGWFELVEWIHDECDYPTDEQLYEMAVRRSAQFDATWMQRFRDMMRRPNTQTLFHEASYRDEVGQWLKRDMSTLRLEALNEHAIAHVDGQRLMTGSIDRLIIVWNGDTPVAADIIDYKTDQVTGVAAAKRRAAFYAPQMQAYRQAIAGMLHLDNATIRTRLLFTQADCLLEIAES